MIVTGVDGSEESKAALHWALDEAKLRGTDVRVIHAWVMPAPSGLMSYYVVALQDPALYQEGAEKFLSDFLAEETRETEGVEIDGMAVEGTPAEVLIDASTDAELLVVGSRGLGGFKSLLLGSVSQQCAAHASCPVVIVR